MKSVLKLLTKDVLLPFGLSAGIAAINAAIRQNIFGSGMTVLIISKKEMEDIKKH